MDRWAQDVRELGPDDVVVALEDGDVEGHVTIAVQPRALPSIDGLAQMLPMPSKASSIATRSRAVARLAAVIAT